MAISRRDWLLAPCDRRLSDRVVHSTIPRTAYVQADVHTLFKPQAKISVAWTHTSGTRRLFTVHSHISYQFINREYAMIMATIIMPIVFLLQIPVCMYKNDAKIVTLMYG